MPAKMMPMGDAAMEAVLDVFMVDLPQTARMLNAGAIMSEILFGKDSSPDDEELPERSVYAYLDGILDGLVVKGVLQTHEDDDWKETDEQGVETNIIVYSLSSDANLIYNAVRRAPLITTVPELVDQYADGTLCDAAADVIADLAAKRG